MTIVEQGSVPAPQAAKTFLKQREGRVAQPPDDTLLRAADSALDHDDPIEEVFEDQIACADLVVLNAKVWTVHKEQPEAEASDEAAPE